MPPDWPPPGLRRSSGFVLGCSGCAQCDPMDAALSGKPNAALGLALRARYDLSPMPEYYRRAGQQLGLTAEAAFRSILLAEMKDQSSEGLVELVASPEWEVLRTGDAKSITTCTAIWKRLDVR